VRVTYFTLIHPFQACYYELNEHILPPKNDVDNSILRITISIIVVVHLRSTPTSAERDARREGRLWVDLRRLAVVGRTAGVGAPRPLRSGPAIVSFLNLQPTLSPGGGNWSSCPSLCENTQEPTSRRIVSSIALFPIAATAPLVF
jgi:hypothetical protein